MIFPVLWRSLSSLWSTSRKPAPKKSVKLQVEQLEGRWVPSATVDLTSAGAAGMINGAIFRQLDQQPSGSGVIDSFVRIQTNSAVEQGYNTSARPLQLDENNSPVFTHGLQLSSVPVVNIAGTNYREFLLDINQKASAPLLSLDELRFFTGSTGNLSGYSATTKTLAGHSAVYDMGANNWVELNASLSHGSGSSDMVLYVPDSVFAGASYVYLYSKFGVHFGNNGGYEEWAAGHNGQAVTTDNTAGLSGSVTDVRTGAGLAGVVMTLVAVDANGNTLTFTALTTATGSYSFSNLLSGTYKVSAGQATGFNYNSASVGTVDGLTDGSVANNHTIITIGLDSGDLGIHYDFTEVAFGGGGGGPPV